MEIKDKKILKKLLHLFKPYIKGIVAILIFMIASVALNMMIPLISKQMMDKGLLLKDFGMIIKMSIAGFAVVMMDQGFGLLETRFRAYISSHITYTLGKNAFKHILKLKMQYFNNANFAEIMNNIGMDVSNISRISDRNIFFIVTSVFRIIGGVVGLIMIDLRLTILVITIMPLRYLLVKYLAKKRKQLFEKFMKYNEEFYSWYGDTIGGVKEIKLWGLHRIKTGQYVEKQRNIVKINIKLEIMNRINEFFESVLFNIISYSLYLLGAYMIFHNSLTVGGLFAFITYSAYVTSPISAILNIGYNFSNVMPSAKRFFDFMDMEREDDKNSRCKVKIDKELMKGAVEFKDVTFSYRDGEPILKNISFRIGQGERVALIGANGSGKSTIINLLIRFSKPDLGKILLDGMDISHLKLKDFREIISVVSQDLYLFDTSIRENIAVTNDKDEISMYKAAKESRAHDFIDALPEKYESRVGRNGARLSGGERQKIAVARALLRDAKIMVFDEATSNYDMKSEEVLNNMLISNHKDKTVIVISHRTDVLEKMDKIIILENGSISDVGTHEELNVRSTLYRSMINRYDEKTSWNAG